MLENSQEGFCPPCKKIGKDYVLVTKNMGWVMSACIKMSMFYRCLISMFSLSMFCLFYIFAFLCFVVLCFVIDPKSEQGDSVWGDFVLHSYLAADCSSSWSLLTCYF